MTDQSGGDAELAQRRGGQVGVGAALAMGGLLMLAAYSNPALAGLVLLATLAVSGFAQRLGQRIGPRIAGRGLLLALGWGALAGLACLGAAAVTAGGLGLLWAGYDGFSDPHLFYNYVRKPVLAVLLYGLMPALLWGTLAGGVLWGLTRARKLPSAK